MTQNQESSSDSPDLRQSKRDSIEISQEALDLILNESVRGEQIAGSPALRSHEVGQALEELGANAVIEEADLGFIGKLDPALPPVPFRSIDEGADFSQPAQEGTGNEG